MSFVPDRVFYAGTRPLVVVEARDRAVASQFRDSLIQQLNGYSTACNSPWFLLVDPESTSLYHTDHRQPVVTVQTRDIVSEEIRPTPRVVGEQTLLLAIDKWLHDHRSLGRFADRHPQLRQFVTDVSSASTIRTGEDLARESRST